MLRRAQARFGFNHASLRAAFPVVIIGLLLLAVLTATLIALQQFVDVGTVTIFYLIAVLFAAIRGGVVPAVICAVAAVAAAAFFFYPPIYDLRVYNPIHVVDIILFIFVAIVTGKLATDVRVAKMREQADALRGALIELRITRAAHAARNNYRVSVGACTIGRRFSGQKPCAAGAEPGGGSDSTQRPYTEPARRNPDQRTWGAAAQGMG